MLTVGPFLPPAASHPSNQTVKKRSPFVSSVLIRFGWISNLLVFLAVTGVKEETQQ